MNLIFKFSEQEINLILGALSELPAKVSMNLIMNIQANAQAQLIALQQPEAKAAEPAEEVKTPEGEGNPAAVEPKTPKVKTSKTPKVPVTK